MKAWRLNNIGDFALENVEDIKPAKGEVLVKVKACGICGSDIPRVYQNGAHKMPLTIGHEFAGEVVDCSAEGKEWARKKVAVFPLIPCGRCPSCLNKKYELCSHYDYLGSRRDGALGEYVSVPISSLMEIPKGVSYEKAAMTEPMAVAVHAIRRLNAPKDDYVLVEGLGTIGLMLTSVLKAYGYKNILVVGNKEFQFEKVVELGIDENNYIDCTKENVRDAVAKKTDGEMVAAAWECVGKSETYEILVDVLKNEGKGCLVGNPYSDMTLSRDIYWKILRKQLWITGTWNSSFTHDKDDDWHEVMRLVKEDKVDPGKFITHTFDLDNIINGFEIMRDKKENYIKIMCVEEG